MATFDTILEQMNRLQESIKENRGLLNQLVSHVNSLEAHLELVRQAQVSQGESIAALAKLLSSRAEEKKPTLTPLPMAYEVPR